MSTTQRKIIMEGLEESWTDVHQGKLEQLLIDETHLKQFGRWVVSTPQGDKEDSDIYHVHTSKPVGDAKTIEAFLQSCEVPFEGTYDKIICVYCEEPPPKNLVSLVQMSKF